MNLKRLAIVTSVSSGVVATLTTLWLFGSLGTLVSARSAFSIHSGVADAATHTTFTETPLHYVAVTGTNSGDCSTPASACRTLQYAVDRAGEGDEIRVATGVYTDVNVRPRRDVSSTGVVTQVVYVTKSVTIRGGYTTANWSASNPISYPTTLDARGKGRLLYISGEIDPTIEGLRLTGGDASGLGASSRGGAGGGVYAITATVIFKDNQVFENSADDGGGLYLYESDVNLIGNNIFDNTASGGGGIFLLSSRGTFADNTISNNDGFVGGGLYMFGDDATFDDNVFSSNSAVFCGGLRLGSSSNATFDGNIISSNVAWEDGGGLCLSGSKTVFRDNRIVSNGALYGGGLSVAGSDVTLDGNTISSNTAHVYGSGGGLDVFCNSIITLTHNTISFNASEGSAGGGLSLSGGVATLDGNTIFSNTAVWGGGMYLSAADVALVNNVIAENRAQVVAGGLYLYTSDTVPRLVHNTFVRNAGGGGSGIYVTGLTGTVALTNNILVSHTVGISVASGNTAKLAGTLWGTGSWANTTDWGGAGTVITGAVSLWGDPAFIDPDGGDYHVDLTSAAVDQGVDASVNDDLDRDPRPFDADRDGIDEFDIGADEVVPHLDVIKQATPNSVQPGEPLTFTIHITNTGNVDLHATITDTLPNSVTLGQTSGETLTLPGETMGITWTAFISARGGVWMETFIVTVEEDVDRPLTNVVEVTTEEGAAGDTRVTVNPYKVYLPLVTRNY